jgi:hypothetical protein
MGWRNQEFMIRCVHPPKDLRERQRERPTTDVDNFKIVLQIIVGLGLSKVWLLRCGEKNSQSRKRR